MTLDGEELYNQITLKYNEANELINHLLDIGEDVFEIANGRDKCLKRKRELSKDEKEFYDLILEAKRKLYQTRERVLKAKIKRARNTFGNWSKMMRNKELNRQYGDNK